MGIAGAGLALGSTPLWSGDPVAGVGQHAADGSPDGAAAGPSRSTAGANACRRYLEFSSHPGEIERLAAGFGTGAWRLRFGGLVERERDIAVRDLLSSMPMETRVHAASRDDARPDARWTGFPLAALVRWARPLPAARYLQVAAFVLPGAAPNQARASRYPWPYREALTLEDALDPRAFVATGLDGRAMPSHRGAPMRLVLPWKHGTKSVKAIGRFEFTDRPPRTFRGDLRTRDYDFSA